MRLSNCMGVEQRIFHAAGLRAKVQVQAIELPIYAGPPPRSTWRKPVVGPPGRPFAELLVAADLGAAGWSAAWVYRPGQFLSSWEPRQYAHLPRQALKLHEAIKKRAGAQAGCWDVFAWRADEPLFVELKRAGSSDQLRASQLRWRAAALALGVSSTSFLVAEWTGGHVSNLGLEEASSAGRSVHSLAAPRDKKRMSDSGQRTDDSGRAYAGSQLQVQIYVSRRAKDLSAAIARTIEAPDEVMKSLRWTAPREEQRFSEPYDGQFLEALGLPHYKTGLAEFWPEGGPHWDALAVAGEQHRPELVLLVEGKSYPGEVYGPGCQATADASKRLISAALERTRGWLHAGADSDWTGRLYQYANRLAHLYFIREIVGVSAWLVNLCFVGDVTTNPTTEPQWRAALPLLKKELGFAGGTIPWVVDVLLPGRPRSELLGHSEQPRR